MSEPLVVWLQDCDTLDAGSLQQLVGGKASGLGALMREGFQVPPGFAVTTRAYLEHIDHNRLADAIQQLLQDCDSMAAQQRASAEIQALFLGSRPSAQLEEELLAAHARLGDGGPRPLAVRSSANAEDLADASFAGQQETYLWIIGADQVLQHVVRCWASLFTPQAIAYRAHLQIRPADLAMGVVVQVMVPAHAAGVMLTIDPLTGDPSGISIEGSYGLGAAVVNGEVTPDRFTVDKVTLEIRSRVIGRKAVAYRFQPDVQGTRREPVLAEDQTRACLTDAEVVELASLGKRLERVMGRPQDMEWAIGPGSSATREVFLVQARPETVWSRRSIAPVTPGGTTLMDSILRSMRTSVTSDGPT